MAETRSQALLKEALVRATIDGEIKKKIDEVFTAIYVKVDTGSPISFQNQNRATPEASATPEALYPSPEVMRGLRSSMHSNYSSVTRLAKLGFPRFNGDKIREWLFKVEQFFEIDQIPDELKIGFASIHFDGLAITWHESIAQSGLWKHIMHDWETYKLLLLGKYSKHVDDSIAQLKQLQETEGIEEYHARFGLINTTVDIDEDYLVSVYLAGLRTDTRENVQIFQPQTVNQCFLVGRLYEQAHPLKRDIEMKAEEEKEVAEIEVETKSSEKRAHEVNLKEDLTTQFQVHVSDSKILRNIEFREENLELENLEYLVKNEDLKQEWDQNKVNMRFEVGVVERIQQVTSMAKNIPARQLFGKRSHDQERLKLKKKRKDLKSWMFKYKQENERLWRLHNHVLSFPNLCALRIDGLGTRRKRTLLGRIAIVHVKFRKEKNDQWLGYDLIINNNNWTKLGVKKGDNLSWKKAASDESRSRCCIKKLGGTSFIYKNVVEKIHDENLEILACQLCEAMTEGSAPSKVIGTDWSKRLGSSEISCDMGYDIQPTKLLKRSTACCCKAVYARFHVWLLHTSLIIQQVMRNTKIKFSKRWWFKYKYMKEGMKSLQIQSRYQKAAVGNVLTSTQLPSIISDVFVKEPAVVLDRKMVKRQGRAATMVLIQWTNESVEGATWEYLYDLQKKFPSSEPCGQGSSNGGALI